ncbi:MAG: phosphodiester glycosidase family protein [Terricaulis sp.]
MNLPRIPLVAMASVVGIFAAAGLFILPQLENRDAACEVREFETSRFIVCSFDPRRQDMRLYSRASEGRYLRGFEALQQQLGADARRVRFAMNAGMYNDAGAPIGLYVQDGEEQKALSLTDGPGNFHLKPNGVFWQGQDGALHIDVSETYARELHQPRWATQSGPMLLIDGELHPRIAEDGVSRFVRNGVGLVDQHTAYFVISTGFVSFGRFARFFRDELRCRDALFLDGTVSSLWAPSVGRFDDNHELGPMVVVLDRR